jgi:Mrp family chromosome partitioning ATPase
MELTDHLRVMWRRRWVILALSLLVAGLVFARSQSTEEVYRSEALLSLTAAGDEITTEELDFLVGTYTGLAATQPVLSDAVRRSELRIGTDAAARRIEVSSFDTGGLIKLSATGPTRDAARSLAAGASSALVAAVERREEAARENVLRPLAERVRSLREQLRRISDESPDLPLVQSEYQAVVSRQAERASRPVNRLDQVQPATIPDGPVAPTPARDAMLALLVALVVNAELMVVAEALGGRFRTDELEAIRDATGLPVLAAIPDGDAPATLEAFRRLRTGVAFSYDDHSVRTLAVVGVEQGVGKTHVAIGLARQTPALGLPVVLIDADLRHPEIHRRFGLPLSPGLGDLAAGGDPGTVSVAAPDDPGLSIITAGSPLDDPGARLSADLTKALAMLGSAELTVIDTPAASVFAEAYAVAAQCDGTIVVIDAARSHRREVVRLVDNLRQLGARPLGVVLNRTEAVADPREYQPRAPEEGAARAEPQ